MKKIIGLFLALILVLSMLPAIPASKVKADDPTPHFKGQMVSEITWTAGGKAFYTLGAERPDGSSDGLKYDWFLEDHGNIRDLQDPSWEEAKNYVPGGKWITIENNAGYSTIIFDKVDPELDGFELFCIAHDDAQGTAVQSERTRISVSTTAKDLFLRNVLATNPNAMNYHFNFQTTEGIDGNDRKTISLYTDDSFPISMQLVYGIDISKITYDWYTISLGDNNRTQFDRLQTAYAVAVAKPSAIEDGPKLMVPSKIMPYSGTDYYVCMISYNYSDGTSEHIFSPIIRVDWNTGYGEGYVDYTAPDTFIIGLAAQTKTDPLVVEKGTNVKDLDVDTRFFVQDGLYDYSHNPERFFYRYSQEGTRVTVFDKVGTFGVRVIWGKFETQINVKVVDNSASPTPTATSSPTPTPTATNSPTPTATNTPTPTTKPTNTPTPTKAPTNTPSPEPTKAEAATPTPEPTQEATPTPTPEPTKEATPTPEPTKEPTPTSKPVNTPTPTLAPTATSIPRDTPTPLPNQNDRTNLSVPLVVTLVIIIAIFACAIGILSTIIFMKKKNAGQTPGGQQVSDNGNGPDSKEE